MAIGPGKRDKKGRLHPLVAKLGQTVIFGDGNFDFYPIFRESPESEPFRIIQEADICGIVDYNQDVINEEIAA